MSEKSCHGIMQVNTFVDEKGREVTEFMQVFGKDKGVSRYRGTARLIVSLQHPMTGQVVQKPTDITFSFPEDVGLKKAFDLFDDLCEKRIAEWKEEQQKKAEEFRDKNRVVGAAAIPPVSQILGPNGKQI